MANWHVTTGTADGNSYRVAFHIGVPATKNRAGLDYAAVLLKSGSGASILPDGDGTVGTISPDEKAAIESGALQEIVEEIATNPSELKAAFKARLDARFNELQTAAKATLAARLNYFGLTDKG
jgi:hypothetical protein